MLLKLKFVHKAVLKQLRHPRLGQHFQQPYMQAVITPVYPSQRLLHLPCRNQSPQAMAANRPLDGSTPSVLMLFDLHQLAHKG